MISSSFRAENGSLITGLRNTRVANINGVKEEDKNPHIMSLDGTITDCTYGDVLFGTWYARYIIGPNAVIENTTASSRTIGMFYLQNGGEINFEGKVQNNNNTVVYMGNQGGGATIARVKDGAYIHNNQGYGIYANNSGYVIMEGGEISNSSYGIYVRSKSNWRDAALDMSGGRIVDNSSYGVYFATTANSTRSWVNITGGEISGNGYNQLYISGSYATDSLSRCHVASGVVRATGEKAATIGTSFGTLTMDVEHEEIYLGGALSKSSAELKKLVGEFKVDAGDENSYAAKGSALWFKPTMDSFHFMIAQPSKWTINYALPLYVAYIPLQADGTPMADAILTAVRVNNKATIDVTLDNLTPNQSYALMWMQPTEKFGTLALTAPAEVNEVLGTADYEIPYTATYTLSKDIKGELKAGDEIAFDIILDEKLTYKEGTLNVAEDSVFELVETDPSISGNAMTVTLRLKEDYDGNGGSAALDFATTMNIPEEAEFVAGTLRTDVTAKGTVLLPGKAEKTSFTVLTPAPCETKLVPLSVYTVTYADGTAEGGSLTVKEGTKITLNPSGEGEYTLTDWAADENGELSLVVMGDVVLPSPELPGYLFDRWSIAERNKTDVNFNANWWTPTEYGTLVLDGTASIEEVLGTTTYDVDYAVTYAMSEEIREFAKSGDGFTVTLTLDEALSYQGNSLNLSEESIYELVNATVESNILTVELRLKEGYTTETVGSVRFTFQTNAQFAEFPTGVLRTEGKIAGTINVSGKDKTFEFEAGQCDTQLVPLANYTISYDNGTTEGGSLTVKAGTQITVDTNGGVYVPTDGWDVDGNRYTWNVTENIILQNPVREGYAFDGWTVDEETVTFTANWEEVPVVDPTDPTDPENPTNPEEPTNPTTPENPNQPTTPVQPTPDTPTTPVAPTTPVTPAPTPTAPAAPVPAPTAPAPAAPAPTAPAVVAVPDTAVPLAQPDAEEDLETVQDDDVPLANVKDAGVTTLENTAAETWALMNLILMIVTALLSVAMVARHFAGKNREDDEEDDQENARRKESGNKGMLRLSSLLPTLAAIILFVLTTNLDAQMVLVNGWTILMLVFAIVNGTLTVLTVKNAEGSKERAAR